MNLHPGQENFQLRTAPAELEPIRHALYDNDDWYRDLIEHSQDLLCVHDLKGRLLSVNPAPARLLGYSVEELLQIPMRQLIAPAYQEHFDVYLEQIGREGKAKGLLEVVTRSGERRIWEYSNTLRREGVPEPIVRGMARDVTEQKRAESLLQEASKLNQQLVASVGEGIVVYDRNLCCVMWNPCMEAMTGIPASEAIGRSYRELIPSSVKGHNPEVELCQALQGRTVIVPDEKLPIVGSGLRWISSRKGPLRNAQGEIAGVIVTCQDITERKHAETELRFSENRYRALHESSPVGVCWVESKTGRFLGVNPKYCEIAGRMEQDLLGRDFQSITHPDDLPFNLAQLQQLAAGEARGYSLEKRYIRPDGSVRWVEAEIVAMAPEGEKPDWHMAIVQDITERKRAEERLLEYERVLEGLEEMIVVVDRDYRYAIANRAYLKYRSINKEQVIGRRVDELLPPAASEIVKRKLNECFQGKVVQYEMKCRYPQLGERDLFVSYFPIDGETGVDRIAGVLQDITERKRAEEGLRQQAAILELAHDAILVRGMESSEILLWNRGAADTYGWRADEVLGQVSYAVLRTEFSVPRSEIEKRVTEQGEWEGELKHYTREGKEILVASRWSVVRDDQGVGRAILEINRDITERKRAEDISRRSEESYRKFIAQSSEGIFREELDAPLAIDLPEDELVHHILHDSYMAECNDALAKMYGLTSSQECIGKRLTEMVIPDDPRNIELARQYIRSGFRILERESHEVDVNGNPKVFLNSMIGTVENGHLERTWGIQRDITEKVKLEEARARAEDNLCGTVERLQQVTEELRLAKEKLAEEKLYLEEAIDTELGFGEIIGRSRALKQVMEKVAKVAPSDATVLLLGETGTGKELVARALHNQSKRHGKSFIKMNCAAIPSGLLESELFGHEKGAFTGAVGRKLGRLELADRGTLFLDEIGEIPLSLQPKLLRVLQDMEFERLGSNQTLKVNFRLLAATNRDLLQSVNAREFRSDLYYRLNVFPINIPPLRERREDIRLLVEHFVRKFAAQMKKPITSIPSKTMELLVRWEWPGNIRELENFIERSVILTPGSVLQSPLAELQAENGYEDSTLTLRDKDRERILRTLRDCHGKLGGADGAAARLGLKRTTLQSKLDHLGIKPATYRV